MDKKALEQLFADDRKIICLHETESTNTFLLDALRGGKLDTGDIVTAERQLSGKGRHGKSFASPEGGIYTSFAVDNIEYGLSTVMCGLAVAMALEKIGLAPEIKWVNDVLIDGKKVCGILAQAVGDGKRAVVGFGINTHIKDIPKELENIATALDAHTENKIFPEKIVFDIIKTYESLSAENAASSSKRVIEEYEKRMNILGKEITVLGTGEKLTATGVASDGALIALARDGKEVRLSSGEISVRKAI